MTSRTPIAALLLLCLLPQLAAADEDPIPEHEAPQRFLDAFREDDRETMRAIATAGHDVHPTFSAIFASHVLGMLSDPPAPKDYFAALRAFADLARERKATERMPALVEAWAALGGAELTAEARLRKAHEEAVAALTERRFADCVRLADNRAQDLERRTDSLFGAYLRIVKGQALVALGRPQAAERVFTLNLK